MNQIKNRTAFEFKTGCYLERLLPETMKLLKSTKSGITKNENYEKVPYIAISEVVLARCNIFSNDYQYEFSYIT